LPGYGEELDYDPTENLASLPRCFLSDRSHSLLLVVALVQQVELLN
jgi:hypothetical protein